MDYFKCLYKQFRNFYIEPCISISLRRFILISINFSVTNDYHNHFMCDIGFGFLFLYVSFVFGLLKEKPDPH